MLAVEDLVDLGEKLRAASFKLAPHQILSAQHVLAALEARQMLPPQRHQLAPWLGPIFCTSPTEQERFAETFNEWLREHFGEGPPKREQEPVPEVRPAIVPPRLRLMWKPVLALFVLFLAASTAWAAWQHWQPRVITGTVVISGENDVPLLRAEVQFGERSRLVTDENGNFSFTTRAADLPLTMQVSYPGFASLHNELVGEELALARKRLYLGGSPRRIELGQIGLEREGAPQATDVVIEMPAEATATPDPIGPPRSIDLLAAFPEPPLWKGLLWNNIAWTLLPVIAFLFWQLWHLKRRPVLQRQASAAPPQLREMHLPPGVAALAPGLPMRRLAQELRRRRVVNSAELQVDLTIAATLRNAGLFTPMLGSRVEPEYVALVDTACLSDHQARLCNEFVAELARSDVQIDRYTFDRTPAMLQRREAKGVALRLERAAATVSIDSLHARTPEHRVLLFCDGSGLFDSFTGAPAPCVATLLQWESLFLLTGKPPEQWGETEWALENLGFKVLPLTREGVLWLMSTLSGAPAPHLARTSAKVDRPAPRYDRARRRWLERNPPDAAEVRRLCDSLAADLGERGFAWLAGCAVYPEIHWGITLRVGGALVPDHEQREMLLPRLARLIWLRDAYMPDWLRQALLERLSAKDEHRIREVMYAMLVTLSGEPGTDVPLQIATSAPIAARGWRSLLPRAKAALDAWRKRRRAESLIRSASADSPLRDYVFLRFISGQSAGKLALTAPGAFLKLLFRGGSPFLGFRPTLVLGTALIASGAIAVALGLVRHEERLVRDATVQFNSDGSSIAAMVESAPVLGQSEYDLMVLRPDGTPARVVRGDTPVEMSPDQKYLVYAEGPREAELRLRDAASGELRFSGALQMTSGLHRSLRFSRNSRWLAFGAPDGKIALVPLAEKPRQLPHQELPAEGLLTALTFSADSRLLAASVRVSDDGPITGRTMIWQLQPAPAVSAVIETQQSPQALELSADGRQLLAATKDAVVVWDVESRQKVREMPLGDIPADAQGRLGTSAAVLGRDGRVLAVTRVVNTSPLTGKLTLLEVASGARLGELADADMPALLDVDFSPDGTTLAATAMDGTMKLWSIPESYPAPRTRRSFALVIANTYLTRNIDEPDPQPMAARIADILRTRYGFGVTHLPNATGAQIRDALRQFGELLQPEDQLLIYLAGRGRVEDGNYAFLGSDTRRDDDVRGGTIAALLQSINAGQVLVIADTPDARALASFPDRNEDAGPLGSRELIASYTEGRPDLGGRSRGSPFAVAFAAALGSANGPHSSSWLRQQTAQRMRAAGSAQVPSYTRLANVGDSGGEFEFPAPRTAAAQEPPPEDPNARLAVGGQVQREGNRIVMDFGDIELRYRGRARIAEITNTLERPVRLRASWNTRDRSQPAEFPGKDSCTGRTLGPKERCELLVEFVPVTIGALEYRVRYMEGTAIRAEILVRGNSPSPYEPPPVEQQAPVQQQAPEQQQTPRRPRAPQGLAVDDPPPEAVKK